MQQEILWMTANSPKIKYRNLPNESTNKGLDFKCSTLIQIKVAEEEGEEGQLQNIANSNNCK